MKKPQRQEDWMAISLKGMALAALCLVSGLILSDEKYPSTLWTKRVGILLAIGFGMIFMITLIIPDPKPKETVVARPTEKPKKKRRKLFRMKQ